MLEACSNYSHTFSYAKEEVNQLKKDEGNSVSLTGRGFYLLLVNWSFPVRYQLQSVTLDMPEHQWVMFTRTHDEQHFHSSKLLLSPIYRQTSPWHVPSPWHTPHASKESCGRLCCNAWLPAENSIRWCLVIFFLFLHWRLSLKMTVLSGGTAKPQYAIVNLTFNTLWSNWVRNSSVRPESS